MGTVTDHYCMECFKPCQNTDRGPLCDEHYDFRACEVCGNRADVTYPVLACAKCLNEGRCW